MKIVGGPEEKCIVILLGTAQDAGVPQLGCQCTNCVRAASNDKFKRHVASVGIINQATGKSYIIDATLDFKEQFLSFQKLQQRYIPKGPSDTRRETGFNLGLGGIFLTHIHMGHYIGLLQLGKEGYSSNEIPVYATKAVVKFLTSNRPFNDLIRNHNISLKTIIPDKPCLIERNLAISPFLVQHRQDFSDTVGYVITGLNNRVVYIPDMDTITKPVLNKVSKANIAILDGTFYNRGELPKHRSFESTPHPPIEDSFQFLKQYSRRTRIFFTHFNHTNPVLEPESEAAKTVKSYGFGLAPDGWTFSL